MIDLDTARALIDDMVKQLGEERADAARQFGATLSAVESLAHHAIETSDYKLLNRASVLGDALFLVLDNGVFVTDVSQAGAMLARLSETLRHVTYKVCGFKPEDFTPETRTAAAHLLFLRPLASSNRYQLLNRFHLAKRRIITLPREIPLLSLEASLHRIFQPTHVTITVGGVFDAFGMGRAFVPAATMKDAWQAAVETIGQFVDVIFVVPSDTGGIAWEYSFLKRSGHIAKTIACMIPLDSDPNVRSFQAEHDEFESIPSRWAQARIVCEQHGITLPHYDERGAFLFFGPDGQVKMKLGFESLWTADLVDAVMSMEGRRSQQPAV